MSTTDFTNNNNVEEKPVSFTERCAEIQQTHRVDETDLLLRNPYGQRLCDWLLSQEENADEAAPMMDLYMNLCHFPLQEGEDEDDEMSEEDDEDDDEGWDEDEPPPEVRFADESSATTKALIAPLLQYIQSSTKLRFANICTVGGVGFRKTRVHSTPLFQSVAQNTYITTVRIGLHRLSPTDLAYLVRHMKSLQDLQLDFSGLCGMSTEQNMELSQAFAATTNTTLQRMVFLNGATNDVLVALGSSPNLLLLRELHIPCNALHAPECTPITCMFQSTQESLQILNMQHAKFDSTDPGSLLYAFRHLPPILIKLTITDTVFVHEQSFAMFVEFIGGGGGLRELVLDGLLCRQDRSGDHRYNPFRRPSRVPTIGWIQLVTMIPTLEILDLGKVNGCVDLSAFFTAWATVIGGAADKSRLRIFKVNVCNEHEAWKELLKLIPHFGYLRELTVEHNEYRWVNVSGNVNAVLRCNGSLHHVSISRQYGHVIATIDDQINRIYGQRNQLLPQMLSSTTTTSKRSNDTTRLETSGSRKNTTTGDNNHDNAQQQPTALGLFPLLFAVAQHTPRTGPNAILTGLLTLEESISCKSRLDRKRMI